MSADLIHLTLTLTGWMLFLGGCATSPAKGATLADRLLTTGAAYQSWLNMVRAQGGDISVFENPAAAHRPTATRTLLAAQAGFFAAIDCTEAGWAVQRLGAGRLIPGGPVSAHAGIEMHAKLGHQLAANQPLITLYAEDESLLDEPYQMLRDAIRITPTAPTLSPLIGEVITHSGDE